MSVTKAVHLVVFDNEAVVALRSASSPEHRKVVSHLQVVAQRKRRAVAVSIVVPTTVRVEAGWDRTAADWAFANQVGVADVALSAPLANLAAAIRFSGRNPISVADSHIGAIVRSSSATRVTVLSSDPSDMRAACGDTPVVIVTL